MPKQIFDVKEFLALADTKGNAIRIKKNKDCVKFKCRTPRNLITLVMKDTKKAAKLEASLKSYKPQVIKN